MSYTYTSFGYDGSTCIAADPIRCDICNSRCGDDFEFFLWPGHRYEAVLCPTCIQSERERLADQVEFWLDELGEYVTEL